MNKEERLQDYVDGYKSQYQFLNENETEHLLEHDIKELLEENVELKTQLLMKKCSDKDVEYKEKIKLQQRIDKAIEYIEDEVPCIHDEEILNDLLQILKGEHNVEENK